MAVSTIKAQNVLFVEVLRQITIPANDNITLDFSSELGGRRIKSVDVYLNTYHLPYVSEGQVKTWVSFVQDGSYVRITNTTSAWTNFSLYALIAC